MGNRALIGLSLALALIGARAIQGRVASSARVAPMMIAKGFGGRVTSSKSKGKPQGPKKGKAGLEPDVARLLADANGNLDVAQAMFFQGEIARLREHDPKLYETMKSHTRGQPIEPRVHEKLVEMTWDTVAAYLPVTASRAPPADVKEKLGCIAAACLPHVAAHVLDVGCGDGAILPALKDLQLEPERYLGIDISGRMVEAAQSKHKKFTFVKGNFLTEKLFDGSTERKFDCVLFNGALQFSEDVEYTLQRAKNCLRPGGRIIITHANGATFVKDEKRQNPNVVRSELPNEDELAKISGSLGMSRLHRSQLCGDREDGSEEFYLEGLSL